MIATSVDAGNVPTMDYRQKDGANYPRLVRTSSSDVCIRRSEGKLCRILRLTICNLTIFLLVFILSYSLFQVVFSTLEVLVDHGLDAWAHLNRENYTIKIRRFDDDLLVLTMIDTTNEFSYLIPGPNPHCPAKETAKDFQRGLEVFTHKTDCFIRFFNETEESYERQIAMLKEVQAQGVPWAQVDTPLVMQAAAQTQFGPVLRRTLGPEVSRRCGSHYIHWLLPASPAMAKFLTSCRCFDVLQTRLQVCRETDPHPTPRTNTPRARRRRRKRSREVVGRW